MSRHERPEPEPSRGHLRAIARAILLVCLSLALAPVCLTARALDALGAPFGPALQRAAVRTWARAVARILGMRVYVDGRPPAEPVLMVANHLSYLDVVALWCAAPGTFVAKSEVASWPLVGFLCRSAQTLFIDRQRKRDLLRVLDAMEDALRRGEAVILFAEGTSTCGSRVLPFKSSLFEASVRTGRAVACATLSYRAPEDALPAHLSLCWWGDMTFADHAYGVLRLPRFEARVCFAPELLRDGDRKRLAQIAHEATRKHFRPVTLAEAM
jgi:1-acyl-sn-glycerol-3-phosphate acyltransferase